MSKEKVVSIRPNREQLQLPLLPGEAIEREQVKVVGGVTVDDIRAAAVPAIIPCGVYFLLCDGEVMYVGQSVNVSVRIAEHIRQGLIEVDSYAWVPVDRQDLLVTEAAYIVKFKPKYNSQMLKDIRQQRLPQYSITGNQPDYEHPLSRATNAISDITRDL